MKNIILLIAVIAFVSQGCSDKEGDTTPQAMQFSTPAFADGETIPTKFSCDGEDVSPELNWSNVPEGTESFAIIFDDPDAVPVAGFVWDHMVLYNLPASVASLKEGITASDISALGGIMLRNSSNGFFYQGPCPPPGQLHRYQFELYALDVAQLPNVNAASRKDDLVEKMEGHILGEAVFEGTFSH